MAISLGLDDPESESSPTLVRIHSACFTSEVLGSLKCDCREQLEYALHEIQNEGRGVVLYLFQEGRGIGLGAKIQVYALQEEGLDTVDANTHLGYEEDARSYECALDMLDDLGVDQVRLLTNNPLKLEALAHGGLKHVERVPIEVGSNKINQDYLETKRDRMGHLFSTLELKR
jgi:GTP cyclohydrolase II